MAHLWVEEELSGVAGKGEREWLVASLEGDAFALAAGRPVPAGEAGAQSDVAGPLLVRDRTDAGQVWVLIGPAAARLNGRELVAGLRVLADRDEIRVGSHRVYFSDEILPSIQPFPGGDGPTHCPRCRVELHAGDLAVRCRCLVWFHQTAEMPCFTYSSECPVCGQPTSLDAGYRWSPAEI
jgi:hypothetical protein